MEDVTTEAIIEALTAAVDVSPISISPSRDNDKFPNPTTTSWIVLSQACFFSSAAEHTPGFFHIALLYHNARDVGSGITTPYAPLVFDAASAALINTRNYAIIANADPHLITLTPHVACTITALILLTTLSVKYVQNFTAPPRQNHR